MVNITFGDRRQIDSMTEWMYLIFLQHNMHWNQGSFSYLMCTKAVQNYFFFELEPELDDPEDCPPFLSEEWDLERLRFLSPEEDRERLRLRVLSGDEEGEPEAFGDEPFPDLELERDLE